LLADKLLAPFAVGPGRQVDGAGRRGGARFPLLIGRLIEPQVPVSLRLEGRDSNGPQPGAAAQPLAALGGIDIVGPDTGLDRLKP
jgi:hypothetical protein